MRAGNASGGVGEAEKYRKDCVQTHPSTCSMDI
jgi:hypothetical protein